MGEQRQHADAWEDVADRLATMAVDSALRAKIAAELRIALDESALQFQTVVLTRMFASIKFFVEEWRSTVALMADLGLPLIPIDDHVLDEKQGKTIDDLRAIVAQILKEPGLAASAPPVETADGYEVPVKLRVPPPAATAPRPLAPLDPRSMAARILEVMRKKPTHWWTVKEIAGVLGVTDAAVYGANNIDALVDRGAAVCEKRKVGIHNVRMFRPAPKDASVPENKEPVELPPPRVTVKAEALAKRTAEIAAEMKRKKAARVASVPDAAVLAVVEVLEKRRPGKWLTADGVVSVMTEAPEFRDRALDASGMKAQVAATLERAYEEGLLSREGEEPKLRYRAKSTAGVKDPPTG